MPYPDLDAIGPNMRFYADHKVKGVFAEGCYQVRGGSGEFAELRTYLLSKLMWNPNLDAQAGVYYFDLCRSRDLYSNNFSTEILEDKTTPAGYNVHLPNKGIDWSVQWRPWPDNRISPAATYRFQARVKIAKKSDVGDALEIGAYDNKQSRNVVAVRLKASDLPSGEWRTVEVGNIQPSSGTLTLYLATTDNVLNVPDIYVERFELIPIRP